MFGGRVDFVHQDRRKYVGFRRVSIASSVPWLEPPHEGELIVSHGEHVVDVPSCMSVIASSDAIHVDGLAHTSLPIWSFQPHPEATSDFLRDHDLAPPLDRDVFQFGWRLVRSWLEFAARHG
jgi:GMP synthase-like glutamine amidotransferase